VGTSESSAEQGSGRGPEFPNGPTFDGSAIRKSREAVSERQLFEEFVLSLKLPMQFNHAVLNRDTSEKFSCMKRLREIVVGTSVQALNDLVFRGVAGKQDGVYIGIATAYISAELKPCQIRHLPVCYYDGVGELR
jgi:hypothetical protein